MDESHPQTVCFSLLTLRGAQTADSDAGINFTDVYAQTFGSPALGQLPVRSKALSLPTPPACLELPEGDH